MNLRLPFDNKGFHIGYDIEATYGDLAKKWSPVGSLLVSDTWDTGIGRIGLLGAFSYSQLFSRSDAVRVSNFQTAQRHLFGQQFLRHAHSGICRSPLPSDTDTTGFPPASPECGTEQPLLRRRTCRRNGFADSSDGAIMRRSAGSSRPSPMTASAAASPPPRNGRASIRRALLTAQFLNSRATESWGEHEFGVGSDLSEYNTFPVGCQQNGADPAIAGRSATPGQAMARSGELHQLPVRQQQRLHERLTSRLPGSGWSTSEQRQFDDAVPTGGMQQSLDDRQVNDKNVVQDAVGELQVQPDAALGHQPRRPICEGRSTTPRYGDHRLRTSPTRRSISPAQFPVIIPHKPNTLSATWAAPSRRWQPRRTPNISADPQYTFWRNAMDHIEHSRGHEWAFSG